MIGPLTITLWTLVAIFAAGDTAAHLTHYKYGEAVSASIWQATTRFPILHWLTGIALAVLFTHLEWRIP